MKSKVRYTNNSECHFEVEIPADVVDRTVAEVYKEIKKYAKIPGFRIGNVPHDLLEKYHGEQAREETLKRLIPTGYRQVLVEKQISVVGLPEISDIVFDKGKNLSFKAKVDIRPRIKLKKYKGISVKGKKVEVTNEEAEATLKRLQEMHAQFQPVTEKRPLKKGDYAICDVEAFIDGKPISKKHENMWIEVSKEASMLGMGEDLVGVSVGEIKEVDANLPKDYPDKKYADKKAHFKISVKEIKEKKLSDIDDEFAKDLGAESLSALKEGVRKQLFAKKEANRTTDLKNQILDKLLKDYKISVPPSVAQRQFEILAKRLEEELLSKGIHKDSVAEKKKELEPRLKEEAQDKVRVYFLLEAISEKENIKVKQEDVDKRFETIAQMSQQDVAVVRKHYETNNLIDGLLEQLKEEKTLGWLLSQAEISEE